MPHQLGRSRTPAASAAQAARAGRCAAGDDERRLRRGVFQGGPPVGAARDAAQSGMPSWLGPGAAVLCDLQPGAPGQSGRLVGCTSCVSACAGGSAPARRREA